MKKKKKIFKYNMKLLVRLFKKFRFLKILFKNFKFLKIN